MSTAPVLDTHSFTSSSSQYEVLCELGQGGMGTVFLAKMVGVAGFERLVVLKRLHKYLTSDEVTVRRFLNEARIAAHVHHANVVGIQHVGRDDEGYFLVFDYIEGDSLQGLLERAKKSGGKVPPRIVVRIILDALAGLHAAHETCDAEGNPLGVLHRDVTPQNVVVGKDGVARLTDFGVAKASLQSATTESGTLVGKVLYMPPEYLRRDKVDRRLDIYAMGLTAWIGMSGERPWASTSEGGLVLKIVTQGVPALSTVTSDVPKEIEAVVMRACRKAASERFETAKEMADALRDAAMRANGVATHAEVAAYIERALGGELTSRRRKSLPRPMLSPIEQGASLAPTSTTPPPTEVPSGIASRSSLGHDRTSEPRWITRRRTPTMSRLWVSRASLPTFARRNGLAGAIAAAAAVVLVSVAMHVGAAPAEPLEPLVSPEPVVLDEITIEAEPPAPEPPPPTEEPASPKKHEKKEKREHHVVRGPSASRSSDAFNGTNPYKR